MSYPKPEGVFVAHKEGFETATLMVVADGKNLMFTLSRRQLFGLMAQSSEALKGMEPAEWRPHSAQSAA